MKRFNANASVGLRLKTHRNSPNRYIVAPIRSVLHEFGLNSCAIQRPFEGELEAVLAQCLSAERVVYAESITHHFEDRRRNKVRIFLAAELIGKVKLPNYSAHPIKLRAREFHQSLRERPN
jgi:hypothetical protein